MSNKETIFLEEGQIVFLQSDYENKLVLTSVKSYGGRLDLVGHFYFSKDEVYYNEPEIMIDLELGEMKKIIEFNENGLWMENHNLGKMVNMKKERYKAFFESVLAFLQFSNKDRNKYKCINLNEKCNQLWLSSIAYNSIRKKIITLAYFNGSQSRKKTYHHILVVPKDSINFAVRIKTSYSKGTVFEMINKGLYYEIKRAGIPINMINNKKYEDPRLEEEINKQKDMHDEEGYKQLFKIKETRKRGYYK